MQNVAIECGIGRIVVGKCRGKKLKMTSCILLGCQMKNIYIYNGKDESTKEYEYQELNEPLI